MLSYGLEAGSHSRYQIINETVTLSLEDIGQSKGRLVS